MHRALTAVTGDKSGNEAKPINIPISENIMKPGLCDISIPFGVSLIAASIFQDTRQHCHRLRLSASASNTKRWLWLNLLQACRFKSCSLTGSTMQYATSRPFFSLPPLLYAPQWPLVYLTPHNQYRVAWLRKTNQFPSASASPVSNHNCVSWGRTWNSPQSLP